MRNRLPHIVLLVAILSGCQSKEEELPVASTLMQNMRTRCVGRYLVDLPESFRQEHHLANGPGDATLYFGRDQGFKTVDVTLVAEHVNSETFRRAVQMRSAAIAERVNYEANGPMLIESKEWSPTAVLLRYYSSPDIADSHSHEVHLLVGDAHVSLRTNSFEGQVEPAEARLRALLPQIHSVDDPERIRGGFCLGPVVIASQHDFEETRIGFVQQGHKLERTRWVVDYNTFKQSGDAPSLIARGEANLQGLAVNPDVLRKGKRSLLGESGEEWLGEFKEGSVRQLSFYAEVDGRASDQGQPGIHIEFHSGGQTDDGELTSASLTEEEAVSLWDAVLNSLRKRKDT